MATVAQAQLTKFARRLAYNAYEEWKSGALPSQQQHAIARFMLRSEFGFENPSGALVEETVLQAQRIMEEWLAEHESEKRAFDDELARDRETDKRIDEARGK